MSDSYGAGKYRYGQRFKEYVEVHHPGMKSTELIGQVNNWLKRKV